MHLLNGALREPLWWLHAQGREHLACWLGREPWVAPGAIHLSHERGEREEHPLTLPPLIVPLHLLIIIIRHRTALGLRRRHLLDEVAP